MAIDPLQRGMFRRPGLNIADITGGIMSGVADQPTTQVAAQPLQVASAERPSGTPDRLIDYSFSNWIQGILVTPQETSLQGTIDQWNQLDPSSRNELLRNSPPPPPSDKFLLREDGRIARIAQPSVAAEELSPAAGELSPATEEGPSVDSATIQPIIDAADQSVVAAVNNNETTSEDAEAKRTEAQKLAKVVLEGDPENPDEFAQLLSAVGPSNIDYDQWQSQAKKLLGIEEGEDDVPEWAAPMFMFGLKLMQGPVTGKTEGRSLLGGFLGDVGAAGAAAFPMMVAEKARKKKERAAIATVTMQLEGADAARKKLILEAYKTNHASALNLSKAVSGAFDKLNTRVMNLVPEDQSEKKVAGMFAINSAMTQLRDAGVTNDQLLDPRIHAFIGTYAANEMGITKTPMKLSSQEIGGVKYAWDPKALEAARSQFNKDNPTNQIPTTVGFLSRLVAKDPSVQQYQSLLIGQRADNVTSSTLNFENAVGEKITEVRITNEAAREQWFADNPAPPANASQSEKDAYAEKVKAATPAWQFTTETRLTDSPNYVERSFTNKNGTQTKFYINEAAFGARRKSQPNLTLQEVLLNPEKYSKILGGTIKDYSKLQPNLENILVYDNGLKRTFVIDKNAAGRALEEGKIDAGASVEKLIELGLGRFLGEGTAAGQNEQITTVVMKDGVPEITTIQARDVQGAVTAFATKQEQAKWTGRENSLLTLNSTLWEIDKVIQERGLGVTSKLTDFAGSAVTIGGIVRRTFGITNSQARSQLGHAGLSDETRGAVTKAFGEDLWTDLVTNKEQRGTIKSMFINLAFALASSREGGKLTDNDVKNALETLGWDGKSWTQTPGQVMARMKVAARTANDSFIIDNLSRMSSEDREAYLLTQDENKPDMVEVLLRNRARAIKGAMQDRLVGAPSEEEIFLRYDRKPDSSDQQSLGGNTPFISVENSFESGITDQMNTGTFTEAIRTTRIPKQFRLIHNEIFTPGGEYSVVESPVDFSNRLKAAAQRLKKLNSNLTDQQITEQVNAYKNFFLEQKLFR